MREAMRPGIQNHGMNWLATAVPRLLRCVRGVWPVPASEYNSALSGLMLMWRRYRQGVALGFILAAFPAVAGAASQPGPAGALVAAGGPGPVPSQLNCSQGCMKHAILVGPEMRGSSPLRIDRHLETRQCPNIAGLYPVGEGAGYAGGIVSAAVDGLRSARAIVCQFAPLS